MTVAELIKELQNLPEEAEVTVSVYVTGDQDHYEIDYLQFYPATRHPESVQIKTK